MNEFVSELEYPTEGEYGQFPYPAYDTEILVTARTYTGNPWDEEDKEDGPIEVKGSLLIRPSPFGGYQCFVKDSDTQHAVDPKTVEPVDDEEETSGD